MTWIAVYGSTTAVARPVFIRDSLSPDHGKAHFSGGFRSKVLQPEVEDTDNRMEALMANDTECGFGPLTDLTRIL